MKIGWRWAASLLAATLSLTALGEDRPPDATPLAAAQEWVYRALKRQLKQAVLELDKIAALAGPLARAVSELQDETSRELLAELVKRLQQLPAESLNCHDRGAYFLTRALLRDAQLDGQFQETKEQTLQWLRHCARDATRQDYAELLLLGCRYAGIAVAELAPEALDRVQSWQDDRGAFVGQDQQARFHLTTRVLQVLHFCHGDQDDLTQTAKYLNRLLPDVMAKGYLDRTLETALALDAVGQINTDEEKLNNALKTMVRWDGGLCLATVPGCRSHWSTTSQWLSWWIRNQKKGSG